MPVIIAILLIIVLFGVWLARRPLDLEGLSSHPHPAQGYDQALEKLAANAQIESGMALHDVCHTKLLTHGSQTEHVVVLMHGYTTCPEQFAELGQKFYDAGCNVFIPCMPFHGREDRMSDELGQLTAESLAAYGDWAVDVAVGLGKRITVLGISGGGTVAAWLAQNRPEVDYAVPLAAFLGIGMIPAFLTEAFIKLFMALPPFYIWWDPRYKEKTPYSIFYAYPRYSFRTLAQVLRLGAAARRQAKRQPPQAGKILMMVNDFDPGVSNGQILSLLKIWQAWDAHKVQAYHFEKSMKMMHDIITRGTPGVPVDEVYARIFTQVMALHSGGPA